MNSSQTYTCLNCGLQIKLSRPEIVHTTCACGRVYKNIGDLRTETSSRMHDLPLYSRFGLNSNGSYDGNTFQLIGTTILLTKNAFLNYWTLAFYDGTIRYLEEGYGFQAILTPVPKPEIDIAAKLKLARTTSKVSFGSLGDLKLLQKDEIWGFDIKGESAFAPYLAATKYLFEKVKGNTWYVIFESENEIKVFEQKGLEVKDLNLKTETIQFSSTNEVQCGSCGNSNIVKYFPLIKNFACPQCNTLNRFESDWHWHAQHKMLPVTLRNQLVIPFGTKITLDGDDFIVIGSTIKINDENAKWQEFTLYCVEDGGFAFLNCYNGHFTLVQECIPGPLSQQYNNYIAYFEDINFRMYQSYETTLIWAEGQVFDDFDYNNSARKSYDYIAPPNLLCLEREDDFNNTWFVGSHVERRVIKKQISPISIPPKIGVGAVDPPKYNTASLLITSLVLGILFLLVHLLIESNGMPSYVVNKSTFQITDSSKSINLVTDTFELSNFRSNVSIDVISDVANNWVVLDYTLVNVLNGQEYVAGKDLEKYSGYEGGESWSEGSNENEHLFTALPKGKYILNIDAEKGTDAGPLSYLEFKTTVGAKRGLNFWFPLLLIFAFPIIILFLNFSRDQKRWEQ